MKPITRLQRKALGRLYARLIDDSRPDSRFRPQKAVVSYREFRRSVVPALYDDVLMVKYAGMWIGIETDGYTHS